MMNIKPEALTDSNKAMSSYLSPLVREIPSSGIRKFFDLVGGNKDIITLGGRRTGFYNPLAYAGSLRLLIGAGFYQLYFQRGDA